MIRIKLLIPNVIGDGPFCEYVDRGHEALYKDDGRFDRVVDKDGNSQFLQWGNPSGTVGVVVMPEGSYGSKAAWVGMVCLPELNVAVPECLFCGMPREVRKEDKADKVA